jgi:hypothetical protein
MSSPAIPVAGIAARARQVRPGQVTAAIAAWAGIAVAWAVAARPQVIKAGTWTTEAVAAVFVAIGWVLGFILVMCPKALIYGFYGGGKIPQPAERAARRQQARDREQKPPPPPQGPVP